MKTLEDLKDISGKRVLLRVDFNMPISGSSVQNDFRIRKTLPTIKFILEKKVKVIILSHLQDKNKKALSLKPVYEHLKKYLPALSSFASDFLELEKALSGLSGGQAVLFENLRFHDGEKDNDETFAKKLSSFGDIYVNEAFSVSHREHASIVGLPNFLPSFIGFLFEDEIKNLSKAFSPRRPFLFILGGAKIETKLPLLQKFSETADDVLVGGILANDFFKAKGFEVGRSAVSKEKDNYSQILKNLRIVLPERVLVTDQNNEELVKTPDNLNKDDSIKDVVIENFKKIEKVVDQAQFILWNGPMGDLETGFEEGTRKLAGLITKSQAKTIIGGGDTLVALDNNILEKFSFVSSGGGAMLDFLANETLPGIEALK